MSEAQKKTWGFDTGTIDASVKLTDDFYQHANGTWLTNNPIPPSETRWGSFSVLRKQSREAIRSILQEIAGLTDAAPGSVEQKVRDFYLEAMDQQKLNAAGAETLEPDFAAIRRTSNADELTRLAAKFHRNGIGMLWNGGVEQDLKASDRYAVYLSQGGLGLPDRDDYLDQDEKAVRIREQYRTHIAAMFRLLGRSEASAQETVRAIMDIETELAKVSMTRVQLRDPEAQYNKMSMGELSARAPNIPWELYLNGLGVPDIQEVIVCQPLFMETVSKMGISVPMEDWRRYAEWCVLNATAGKLSEEFEKKDFEFYGTVLSGQKENKPRWERIGMTIDGLMGEAIGQLYVERHFSPEAKRKINELVDHLFSAYRKRLEQLDWMGSDTKQKALAKLARINRKLAYPDKWRDYSALSVGRDSYLANWQNAYRFEFDRGIAKLGKPVDRNEWGMTPPTVNAYFHPLLNDIVFPAGIMQPPFFNPQADDAVNYAGIGAVIGHELTHGFDDKGSKFDADGNLQNWWTEDDRNRFESKTGSLSKQFGGYVAVGDVMLNGELTLGENIADLGGLTIALEAYRESLQDKKPEVIDGFTPEQRFFFGWAQIWRMNVTDEESRQLARTDSHSPGKHRTNGTVVNVDAFHEAFGTKPGDGMYKAPGERIRIW